jgi:hypothetical protein
MADPTHFYTGWLVDPRAREGLLARFPPRYAIVVAHHVTLKFGDAGARPPGEVSAEIVGEADDGSGVRWWWRSRARRRGQTGGRSMSPGRCPTAARRAIAMT